MTTRRAGADARRAAEAPTSAVLVELDVPTPMRDGTILRSDVYRPAAAGRFPVLLGRTTYGKRDWGRWIEPERTASEGYAVVVNDMRGQFASDGELDPFASDVADGHDTVEWCAAQPWSNGRVGMYGSSACGFAQLQAAAGRPAHLEAIAPMQTWTAFGRGCVFDPGGAFSMYTQEWALLIATGDPARRIGTGPGAADRHQALAEARFAIGRWHAHLPVGELPPLPPDLAPWYYRWLDHPDHDAWWSRPRRHRRAARTPAPGPSPRRVVRPVLPLDGRELRDDGPDRRPAEARHRAVAPWHPGQCRERRSALRTARVGRRAVARRALVRPLAA